MAEDRRRLTRSHDRKVAGVCGGIADYLDADPTIVRLGFIVIGVLTAFGPMFVAYLALWLVMPEPSGAPLPAVRGDTEGRRRDVQVLLLVAFLAIVVMWVLGRGGWRLGGVVGPHVPFGMVGFLLLIAFGAYVIARSSRRRP